MSRRRVWDLVLFVFVVVAVAGGVVADRTRTRVLLQTDAITAKSNGDVTWNLTSTVDGDNLAKALDVLDNHGIKPHELYIRISSGGGPLFEAVRVANMMGRFRQTHAYVSGAAASAAFLIFMASDHRQMGPNTILMWHSIQVPMSVTLSKNAEEFLKRYQNILNAQLMRMACENKEAFNIPFRSDKETWLTVDEARSMCLLTE